MSEGNLKEIPLSKTTKFIVDNRGRTAPTEKNGTPLIATNCINSKNLYPSYLNLRYVSKETYETWFRAHPQPGDILLTLKGSQNGAVCLVPDPVDFVIAQDMVALRADEEIIDPLFLFAALRSPAVQNQIENLDVSGVIPHLKKTDFDKLFLPYPEPLIQKEIGNIYYNLCNKIDLLHRQNKTLEQMAETLFRQWFVEEAGEDWEEGILSDIADINPKYPLKKGTAATYLEMKNVNTTTFNPDGWYQRNFTSGMKFQNGDAILARITPCLENGKIAFITFLENDETGWGSTEYIVIRMKGQIHPFVSYIIGKDKDFRDYAISTMSGSSGRQRASAEILKEYDIKIPPETVIKKINSQLFQFLPKLENNAKQIKTLESLRDTLLPKLMSGEIQVKYDKEAE